MGRTATPALARLAAALGETVVVGPHANAAFLKALVSHAEFRAGRFDTGFIDRHLAELTRVDPAAEAAAIAAAVEALLAPQARGRSNGGLVRSVGRDRRVLARAGARVRSRHHGRRASAQGAGRVARRCAGEVDGIAARAGARIIPVGAGIVAIGEGVQRHVALKSYDTVDVDHLDGDGVVKAPMHGKVLAIFVEAGASVQKGQRVAVVEAMKMEHALLAPADGIVSEILVAAGVQVAEGATILSIESTDAA